MTTLDEVFLRVAQTEEKYHKAPKAERFCFPLLSFHIAFVIFFDASSFFSTYKIPIIAGALLLLIGIVLAIALPLGLQTTSNTDPRYLSVACISVLSPSLISIRTQRAPSFPPPPTFSAVVEPNSFPSSLVVGAIDAESARIALPGYAGNRTGLQVAVELYVEDDLVDWLFYATGVWDTSVSSHFELTGLSAIICVV